MAQKISLLILALALSPLPAFATAIVCDTVDSCTGQTLTPSATEDTGIVISAQQNMPGQDWTPQGGFQVNAFISGSNIIIDFSIFDDISMILSASSSDLSDSSFVGTYIDLTSVTNVDLRLSNFQGADLDGVLADFDQVDFTGATYSAATTFAAGFGSPSARGMLFVPGPSTAWLFGIGLAGLAIRRRR